MGSQLQQPAQAQQHQGVKKFPLRQDGRYQEEDAGHEGGEGQCL